MKMKVTGEMLEIMRKRAELAEQQLETEWRRKEREGARLRDQALDYFEGREAERLELVREYLRDLYEHRAVESGDKASVSADDARDYCDREGIARGPWMGATFRENGWAHVGWKLSRDPLQHATGLRLWQWGK